MKTITIDKNIMLPQEAGFVEWEDFLQEVQVLLEPKINEEIEIYNHIAWAEIMYNFVDKRPKAA